MSNTKKLKKGFDIRLVGQADKQITSFAKSSVFALKPSDFIGIQRPKLKVKVGDTVKAGSPVLFDKMTPEVLYTSPVSGEVVEIVRGAKRRLLEVRILADKELEYETFNQFNIADLSNVSAEQITEQLCASGVWPQIIQRPYGVVANPKDKPKAIFISSFDTHPLAPDTDFAFQGEEQHLQAGIEALSKFTNQIHVGLNAKSPSKVFSGLKGVTFTSYEGQHPAGNVGIQIHHTTPINKGDLYWTVSPAGLADIGRMLLSGKYDPQRVIAVTGSEVKKPTYTKVHAGTSIKSLVEGNVNSGHLRYISGNVLTGEKIAADGFLGYYHNQVTVIPEGDGEQEFLGWITPQAERLSFSKAFGLLSFLNPKKEYRLDTNTRGEKRRFVVSGEFEKVLPMDIYPVHLFKAILAEDYENMEALGIYELVEEDVALCEFIDVSKNDIQSILRKGLDLLQYS
ncbi:Na(+)-translocating NADH-quinone reductase subunit A [Persicobacter psychrovividus]|uniref:Na(+)-translocating NADH-quinone reductase subunit A n=1 Tax=Persicobacter psychrovividus TaxID=387638 RepID=A0ABM7VBB5_9BACT|nr:Na(+)-translocating NADH-quinone reductase subunit A [Persicobacter psychrovividus]